MSFLRTWGKFLSLWQGETPWRGVEGHLVIMRLTESFPGLMVYLCDSTCTQSLFFSINERTIGRGEGRQYFSILRKWGRGEKIGQSWNMKLSLPSSRVGKLCPRGVRVSYKRHKAASGARSWISRMYAHGHPTRNRIWGARHHVCCSQLGDLWPYFLGLGDAFHLPIIVQALWYNK